MCIIGNQKTQEAKNKVIYNHKKFTIWCVLLGLICVFSQLSIHFYVIKTLLLCIMLFHTSWIFTIPKSQSDEYFDNQKDTTPPQCGRKKTVLLNFLSLSFKAVSILKILNCKILIKERFFSLILWLWELTGTALWLYPNSSKINFLPKVIFLIIIFLILICALHCPKKKYILFNVLLLPQRK